MLSRTLLRLRINATCTHVTCVFLFVPLGYEVNEDKAQLIDVNENRSRAP